MFTFGYKSRIAGSKCAPPFLPLTRSLYFRNGLFPIWSIKFLIQLWQQPGAHTKLFSWYFNNSFVTSMVNFFCCSAFNWSITDWANFRTGWHRHCCTVGFLTISGDLLGNGEECLSSWKKNWSNEHWSYPSICWSFPVRHGIEEQTFLPLRMVFRRYCSLMSQTGVHSKNRHTDIPDHSPLCPYLCYSIVKMLNFGNVAISHWIHHVAISFCMLSVNSVFSYQHLRTTTFQLWTRNIKSQNNLLGGVNNLSCISIEAFGWFCLSIKTCVTKQCWSMRLRKVHRTLSYYVFTSWVTDISFRECCERSVP